MIKRPANNVVLEFIENNEMKRKIKVFSTEKDDVYKVLRGLSAKNQVVDMKLMSGEELKQLWIDSVVNGFECVKNELFMRGILDCLPEESLKLLSQPVPKFIENCEAVGAEEYVKREKEEEQQKMIVAADVLYSA